MQELVPSTQIARQGTQLSIQTPDPGGSFQAVPQIGQLEQLQLRNDDIKSKAVPTHILEDHPLQIACTIHGSHRSDLLEVRIKSQAFQIQNLEDEQVPSTQITKDGTTQSRATQESECRELPGVMVKAIQDLTYPHDQELETQAPPQAPPQAGIHPRAQAPYTRSASQGAAQTGDLPGVLQFDSEAIYKSTIHDRLYDYTPFATRQRTGIG
jgi:hypothetical protein